ncbi:uncharacterized protein F4807DRAFT_284163 [Annulohypoxylon truncatum]|uniref:uncharacterized protein n=1 Tax=Annulohypoxylon truncatum TaxID=327061 RepID=UPI00200742CF|nr:uncharacterized protein F4807DRAFT_284163 [Annulohypoxylon truncatum]KAI1205396.1 hypothetical protein F4807DRAFT_284163 [Annulohypoxylon truncatum]
MSRVPKAKLARLPPIRTQQEIRELPANTVFVSIDTSGARPMSSADVIGEVGLALLPRLRELPWIHYGKTYSQIFIENHNVQFYCIRGVRPQFLGNEFYSTPPSDSLLPPWIPEDSWSLRVAFEETIRRIRNRYAPGCKIAIVHPGHYQDFRRIGMTSEDVINCIDYSITHMPELEITFGKPVEIYPSYVCKIGDEREYNYAKKAVWALESLHQWVYPRRPGSAKIEVSTNVNGKFKTEFRAMIAVKKVRFTQPLLPFPPSINSAQKLAEAFESYEPIHVAASIYNPAASKDKLPSTHSIHAVGVRRGCLCFETEKAVDKFVEEIDGLEVDGIQLIVLRIPPNC